MPDTEGLKKVIRASGLLPNSEKDAQDRTYLTRLANDPRHPMTPEMVEALMVLDQQTRHVTLVRWINESILPLDQELLNLTSSTLPTVPKSKGSTDNGEWPPEQPASDAGWARKNGLPSSEASSGAATGAASTSSPSFVESYLRLPLSAKRDAFIHDGFLYVRRGTLREWMGRLAVGKCCPPQREGLAHHSSECWVYQDGKG